MGGERGQQGGAPIDGRRRVVRVHGSDTLFVWSWESPWSSGGHCGRAGKRSNHGGCSAAIAVKKLLEYKNEEEGGIGGSLC